MRKTGTFERFSFDTFSEMVAFLKEDVGNRRIVGRDGIGLVMTQKWDGTPMPDKEAFYIDSCPGTEYGECTWLGEYFDENGNPLDEEFAEAYNVDDFYGDAKVAEK